MGGSGSGTWHRWDKKTVVEDLAKIDVNHLHRNGMLRLGSSGILTWSQMGEEIGSIRIRGGGDRITLRYTYAGTEDIAQDVTLTHTPCHFGATRPWFVCPNCSKRVGTLLGGRTFACRGCYGLSYYSQQCDREARVLHRIEKLERKLERRGLHAKTVERIYGQLNELNRQVEADIYARFGW